MKKTTILFLAIFCLFSCEVNQTTVSTTTPYVLDESIEISIPQTASGQTFFSEANTQDLSQLITNYDDINTVTVNALTYQITNFTGDPGSTVQTATLTANNVTIATISNLNISQEFSNNTVFEINDPAIISQIENILETTSVVNLEASGTIMSSIPLTFHVAIHLDIEVTTD